MQTPIRFPTILATLAVAAVLALGCAPRQQPGVPAGTPATAPADILPGLAELPVLVAPVQRASVTPGLGWTLPGGEAGTRRMADSVLADVLVMRGAGRNWQFADAVRRAARRNPTYAADPDALAIGALGRLKPGDTLPEPLASQLRGLVALSDARHVLLPLELRAEPPEGEGSGTGRATLLVAAVDARLSQLLWLGPVSGAPAPGFTPAAVESAAAHLADLILAR